MSANRTYMITASSGIGAATAKQLAVQKSRFFFVSKDENTVRQLVEDLESRGSECGFLCGDLTEPALAPEAVNLCIQRFGRIDAVFNVAGISGRKFGDGPIHECSEEGWEVTIDTNATTQYRMCREVVRAMLGQEPDAAGQRGVILNMSSILGVDVDARHFAAVAYAASKGAIISMSRAMASYYASHRIRVNVIAPGLVKTAMSERASSNPEIIEYMKLRQPLLGDLIPVEDVAATCVHLLTDASRATTGQVVLVDAGWAIS